MEAAAKQFRKRNAILSCLRGTREHPSAEWIYARLKPEYPDLSLATVYRNLALFKNQGTIASLGTVGGVERFDGDTAPHVHFVCSHCGRVLDMPGIRVPRELWTQAECGTGGRVAECTLTFTGTCGECENGEVKNV